jgi:hypothetical protein
MTRRRSVDGGVGGSEDEDGAPHIIIISSALALLLDMTRRRDRNR